MPPPFTTPRNHGILPPVSPPAHWQNSDRPPADSPWPVIPGLDMRRLGKVEDLHIPLKDGRTLSAGLFVPPDFQTGRKYALVVQIHGWGPDKLWLDGYYPCTTASAAQSLASRGIVVVQVGEAKEPQNPRPTQSRWS